MFPEEKQVNEYVKTELRLQVKQILDEQAKTFDEKIKVQTWFVWLAVFFCLSCFLLSSVGVWSLVRQNIILSNYIEHEAIMSERRELRELKKAQDDSTTTAEYIKQMTYYKNLPDYKGK